MKKNFRSKRQKNKMINPAYFIALSLILITIGSLLLAECTHFEEKLKTLMFIFGFILIPVSCFSVIKTYNYSQKYHMRYLKENPQEVEVIDDDSLLAQSSSDSSSSIISFM